MKKLAIATALAFGVVAGANLAWADCGKCGAMAKAEGKHKGKKLGRWLEKVGVSAEVVKQIQDLRAQWKASKKEARAQIRDKHKELWELLAAPNLDTAKIEGVAGEIGQLKANHVKNRIGFWTKMAGLLSPEQRAKLKEKMAKKKMRKRGHHGEGH
jgi:Spy/CpxP family protein refolding chaperone